MMGVGMAGPTLVAFGTEEQQQRLLRPDVHVRRDLVPDVQRARRRVRRRRRSRRAAVRDGDEWVVNGQKVWTSMAHVARWGLLLARTDPDVPEAPRPLVLLHRHAPARRRGAATAPDDRRGRVQRDLLHRRAHPRLPAHRRGRRRLERRDRDADERARDARPGRQAHRPGRRRRPPRGPRLERDCPRPSATRAARRLVAAVRRERDRAPHDAAGRAGSGRGARPGPRVRSAG